MGKDSNGSKVGLGFTECLQLIFIILKLCGIIEWSWFWVLSPIWITVGLVVFIAAILFIVGMYQVKKDEQEKNQRNLW